jgi:D-alanyl-D-alanine carboxypeptidase
MFGKVTFVALVLACGVALFINSAMKECDNFTIPNQSGKVMIVTGGNSGQVIFNWSSHLQ